MHTLFLREHNRVARKLGEINPQWEDETLFQESRRIVVAEWQHIVYNEWLPILLGQENMNRFGLYPLTKGFSNSYKTNFDPRIKNSFAAAAFRIGHTMIPAADAHFASKNTLLKRNTLHCYILLKRTVCFKLA